MVVRLILQQPESHHDVRWWLMDPAPWSSSYPAPAAWPAPATNQIATKPPLSLPLNRVSWSVEWAAVGRFVWEGCASYLKMLIQTGMAQQALFNVAQMSHDHRRMVSVNGCLLFFTCGGPSGYFCRWILRSPARDHGVPSWLLGCPALHPLTAWRAWHSNPIRIPTPSWHFYSSRGWLHLFSLLPPFCQTVTH